jgi:hypothetical protein
MPILSDGDLSKFTLPNSTPIWMEDNLQKWKVSSILYWYESIYYILKVNYGLTRKKKLL